MICDEQTRRSFSFCVFAGLLTSSGCVGMANQLLYTFKDDKKKALFDGLENMTVAVVVAGPAGFSPEGVTGDVARKLTDLLETNVKGIELVSQSQIADWIDTKGLTEHRKVGIGVKADRVVAVDFTSISLVDSSTIVKGRADFTITVFDVHKNKRLFFREEIEHEYPKNSPAGVSARKFRALYTMILAQHVARFFYDHPRDELFGADSFAI